MGGFTMSIEENKRLIQRFVKEFVQTQDADCADEFIHPDYVNVHEGTRGLDQLKALTPVMASMLQIDEVTLEDMVAEGDKVAYSCNGEGKHIGPLFGVPATGKEVTWTLTAIARIADGKIIEITRENMSTLELYQQLQASEASKEEDENLMDVVGATGTTE
jgi:predicted ester cyclase